MDIEPFITTNFHWGSCIVFATKTAFKKIEALICSLKILSSEEHKLQINEISFTI